MIVLGLLFNLIIPFAIIALLAFIANKELKNMSEEIKKNDPANLAQVAEEKRSPAFHIFLYLLLFSSLGFVLQGVIMIYHQLIEKAIKPSEVESIKGCIENNFDPGGLKFGLAALMVSFVIYHAIAFFINRKLVRGEIRPESLVRKLATYLSMFVLAAMTIGSVVALFWNYLNGELSLKSFAKIGVFLAAAALYLFFYLWEIRRKELAGNRFNILLGISAAISISALIIGFAISDSPRVAREKKMDAAVVDNIRETSNNVSKFYKEKQQTPKTEDFKAEAGVIYKKIDDSNFELCATFKQPATEVEYSYDPGYRHQAGEQCFKFKVRCSESVDGKTGGYCSAELEKPDDVEEKCFGGPSEVMF